ncbi:MAG: glycoside hydrolase family 5 protein [Lachnospiraceae bacterium]|nr:glycoside hydrolase family 5 protein [Lachnospiraceae bacterium]
MITTERNGMATPFGIHGKLHVDGAKLMDEHQNVCQLKGISTHNISLYPEYVNEGCFTQLTDKFGMSTLRIAMYSAEADDVKGYADGDDVHRDELEKMVLESAEICAKLGIYMILDWHILLDYDPNMHTDMAIRFFKNVCPALKKYDNIIYEICNEPNMDTTWEQITNYANQVIPVIREIDPDKVIIVGTPVWSQRVDEAAKAPLAYPNLVYTLHFYADTHKEDLRNLMVNAIKDGLPVFVSEFGICDASGNGPINDEETGKWIDLMNEYDVSFVLWNLSNKAETSAILAPTCTVTTEFSEDDFSECGKRVAGYMK